MFMVYAGVFYFGSLLVLDGGLTFADMFKCIMLILFAAFAMGQVPYRSPMPQLTRSDRSSVLTPITPPPPLLRPQRPGSDNGWGSRRGSPCRKKAVPAD
jgi:hypothetical protein